MPRHSPPRTHLYLFIYFLPPTALEQSKRANKVLFPAFSSSDMPGHLRAAGSPLTQQVSRCIFVLTSYSMTYKRILDCQGSQEDQTCLLGTTKCSKLPTSSLGEAIFMLQRCFHSRKELQHIWHTYSYNTSLSNGENEVKSPSLPRKKYRACKRS